MDIGFGLPISAAPTDLPRWAERVEAGPFSTLAVLDRVVYDNLECLSTLAALAACTHRVRLQSEVVLAALRDPVLLAKQAATVDALSGGRLVLGVGVGSREDDFTAVGADYHRRGRALDEFVATARRVWRGEPVAAGLGTVGPRPGAPDDPPILVGGFSAPAMARAGRVGDGLLSAAPPDWTAELFAQVGRAWAQAGRAGSPRLVGQVNVALGERRADESRAALRAYYGSGDVVGVGPAEYMVEKLITTEQGLRDAVEGFGALGADEVVCFSWSADIGQLDDIAAAVAG